MEKIMQCETVNNNGGGVWSNTNCGFGSHTCTRLQIVWIVGIKFTDGDDVKWYTDREHGFMIVEISSYWDMVDQETSTILPHR